MRFTIAVLLAGVLGFVPVASQTPKTLKASGRVTAISSAAMTIRPGNQAMEFVIDGSTKITGKGVGTKTRALTAAGKPVAITELVEEFDSVTVKYHDVGGKFHAREVVINVKRRTR